MWRRSRELVPDPANRHPLADDAGVSFSSVCGRPLDRRKHLPKGGGTRFLHLLTVPLIPDILRSFPPDGPFTCVRIARDADRYELNRLSVHQRTSGTRYTVNCRESGMRTSGSKQGSALGDPLFGEGVQNRALLRRRRPSIPMVGRPRSPFRDTYSTFQ
jgi:hypothetical protein